ncbi:uncharacterized protein LOC103867797 [Brassica rapa]|uniref:J domain-containing protein n=1 Tax=Brassica campestris TaxID=3711 RepID=M4CM93_BRACM|nr:uncharacterized protein LOC103867797 [Brassica rapa]
MAASGSDHGDTCNNAIHHKTLAESKFNSGYLTSALNHARKALALSPDTEGVSSMVTASDGDAPEWYKILKVEPFSHIDAIKEQYRKLALVLRPDENRYVGCEEGFRLVNEAFEVLSDKVRRSEYDMKLRIRVQGEIGACDGETSTVSNGACSSKIITYTRRKKRVGEGGVSLRRGSEAGEMREEEAEALDRHERLDEEDEGMMTLAEMQSVLKRKKPKVKLKITEENSTRVSREEHELSSGDDTLMEMSTNKEKEALKNKSNKKKKKKTNNKELSEIVDLEYVPRVNRKRDCGKLNQENYMADEDCELYDFDKDRMPRSFKKGQVWAVYDGGDDDRMPRSYCLVSEVVSLNPFKVWMSWLDFEREKLISWVKISSCGRFRVSEKALVEQVKPFSHVVNCERVAREVYQIYPRKGSVWAVYSEINSGLQRRKTRRYEIVVCLTMYSDAYGLSVAYLEKVNEESSNLFKRRDYGCNAVRWVEKDDVAALLSHQIPAKKLPEDQARAGSRESWVLDLASVPPDLVAAT